MLKPYMCPAGRWSIGYGRNLEDVGISTEEAEILLTNDLRAAERQAEAFEWFSDLDGARQEVILEMIFQLGFTGVRKFQRMIHAIRLEDWDGASREMMNSHWHTQTPKRCEELAKIMREGE